MNRFRVTFPETVLCSFVYFLESEERSRCSDWVTDWTPEELWCCSRQDKRFLQGIQIGSRSHPASHSLGTGVFSPGVMRPMREADGSPHLLLWLRLSGAVLVPPLPPYAFMAYI